MPSYAIPGSSLGEPKAKGCNMSSVRLEYGGPEWILAEGRHGKAGPRSTSNVDSRGVLVKLRRAVKAVSSFLI